MFWSKQIEVQIFWVRKKQSFGNGILMIKHQFWLHQTLMIQQVQEFMDSVLHPILENCSFIVDTKLIKQLIYKRRQHIKWVLMNSLLSLIVSFSIWNFVSIFYLNYIPFLFGLFSLFFNSFFLFNRGHILDFFQNFIHNDLMFYWWFFWTAFFSLYDIDHNIFFFIRWHNFSNRWQTDQNHEVRKW